MEQKKIRFLDLRVTDDIERKDLLTAVETVLRHGQLVMGPEVIELETRVAEMCDRNFGIGVGSGTDALFLGLKSLDIGPGDEVITTSLSWIATANAIALTGATAVFADIRDDLNIDPASVKQLVTSKTRAIVPVHFTGKVCDMSSLTLVAQDHNLLVIEDAAQSFGASYRGRKAGSFGIISCFSMNPMKVFAACGEAGMILTDRADLRERLIALRYNGTINREECIMPSLNGRLDTLQAAILLRRLGQVHRIIEKRKRAADWYNKQLSDVVEIPKQDEGNSDVYYTYTIKADYRDNLKKYLEERGVETKIQHPYLMPLQKAYSVANRAQYTNAQKLVKRILCLPVHEKLTKEDVDYVAVTIREFYHS